MSTRNKKAPESATRIKVESAPQTITLSVEEFATWREWLEATPNGVVTIFNAIEEMAQNLNAYARDFNKSHGFDDNVHERYDEAEGLRNAALQQLRFIATTEQQIAKRMSELLLGNALAASAETEQHR
jgi:hypothetical protein